MRIKNNIVANYIGHGLAAVSSIVFIPIYLGDLGIEAYGLIGVFAIFQAALSLLDLGMVPTVNREVARYSARSVAGGEIVDLVKTIEVLVLLLATISAGIVTLASNWLSTHWLTQSTLSAGDVAGSLALIGFVSSFRVVESIYKAVLIGLQRQVRMNLVSSLLLVLRYVGAVAVLQFVASTILAFFWWQAIVSLVSIVVTGYVAKRELPFSRYRASVRIQALRSTWAFSGGALVIAFLSICLTQGDKLILSSTMPLDSFGIYSVANSLVGIVPLMVWPISQALYPRFTELVTTGNAVELSNIYHKGSQLVSTVVAPCALAIIFFGQDIFDTWTGKPNQYESTGLLLALLGTGVSLNALMHLPYMMQLAHGRTSLVIKANAFSVAVLVPLLLVVVPVYGPIGAASVLIILNAFYVLVVAAIMHRTMLTGELGAWYVSDIGKPVGATILVFLVSSSNYDQGMDMLWKMVWIAASIIVGGLSAAFASPILRRQLSELNKQHWR